VKAKRNETLSNISFGLKKPRLTSEEEVTNPASSNPALVKVILASLTISLKELSLGPKRTRSRDKGKDKTGASVWEDTTTALGRACSIVTTNELKSLAFVPFHELVSRHVHKLIQVRFLHQAFAHLSASFTYSFLWFVRSWGRDCISPMGTLLMRRRWFWLPPRSRRLRQRA